MVLHETRSDSLTALAGGIALVLCEPFRWPNRGFPDVEVALPRFREVAGVEFDDVDPSVARTIVHDIALAKQTVDETPFGFLGTIEIVVGLCEGQIGTQADDMAFCPPRRRFRTVQAGEALIGCADGDEGQQVR